MAKIAIRLNKDNLDAVSAVFGEPKRILKKEIRQAKRRNEVAVAVYELPEGMDVIMAGLLFHTKQAEIEEARGKK